MRAAVALLKRTVGLMCRQACFFAAGLRGFTNSSCHRGSLKAVSEAGEVTHTFSIFITHLLPPASPPYTHHPLPSLPVFLQNTRAHKSPRSDTLTHIKLVTCLNIEGFFLNICAPVILAELLQVKIGMKGKCSACDLYGACKNHRETFL